MATVSRLEQISDILNIFVVPTVLHVLNRSQWGCQDSSKVPQTFSSPAEGTAFCVLNIVAVSGTSSRNLERNPRGNNIRYTQTNLAP
jgi:hypothetical protein